MSYGEFAYYVRYVEKNTKELNFTESDAASFFSLTTTFNNLMNPGNL